jgi:hypothetical protein
VSGLLADRQAAQLPGVTRFTRDARKHAAASITECYGNYTLCSVQAF